MPKYISVTTRNVFILNPPISEGDFFSRQEAACGEFAVVLQQAGFELRSVNKVLTAPAKHGNPAVIRVYLIVGPRSAGYGHFALSQSRFAKYFPRGVFKAKDNLKAQLSLRFEIVGRVRVTTTIQIRDIPLPEVVTKGVALFTTTRQTPSAIKLELQNKWKS